MKKSVPYLLHLVAAVILFASCSTSSFITKRRYTKGYYIAHSTKPHRVDASNQVKKSVSEVTPALTVLPEALKQTEVQESASNQTRNNGLITASKAAPSSYVSKTERANNLSGNLSVKNQMKSVSAAIKASKSLYRGEDDALSLFWIVILVILILWLLGLIADIGGLVNLLLLVALILLILWLLRIL